MTKLERIRAHAAAFAALPALDRRSANEILGFAASDREVVDLDGIADRNSQE